MQKQPNSVTCIRSFKSCQKRRRHQSAIVSSDDNTDVFQNNVIFRIQLIADIIFEDLNYSEVLTCRLVNLNFNYFASSYLRQKFPRTSLHFDYNFDSHTYVLHSRRREPRHENNFQTKFTLVELQRVLSASQNFPVTSFTFTNGKLNQFCIQNFLSNYGHLIRELSVQVFCPLKENQYYYKPPDPPAIFILRQLLIRQVPNVESLKLSEFPIEWKSQKWNLFAQKSQSADKSQKYLKNLKYVTLCGDFEPVRLIQEIVRVAAKLQRIETKYSRRIVEANNFNLLTNLNFYPAFSTPKKYEQCLVSRAPHLHAISVALFGLEDHETRKRTAQTLNAIVTANATTLTYFELISPLKLLFQSGNFKLPVLPRVKCLSIAAPPPLICLPVQLYDSDTRKQYFPLGFQFHETFPNLNKIIFKMKRFVKDDLWEEYFSNYEPALSVKFLVFTESDYIPKNCITACLRIFPELMYLQIHTKYFDFLEAARSGLYEFAHLKEFKFDIHLDNENFSGNRFPVLDAALTGFGTQYVTDLCGWYNNNRIELHKIPPQAVDVYRENSHPQHSILNLKELETLEITFVDRSAVVRDSYPLILSQFCRIFAFNQRPQLQLSAEFVLRNNDNLQKIRDAINLDFGHKIIMA